MPIRNSDVANIFMKIADYLDIESDNPFRIGAYRSAAQTVSSLSRNVADMVKDGEDLSELPGIGEDLAGKIETIVKTGSLPQLEELESQHPGQLRSLMAIPDLGPKRVHQLNDALGVKTLDELEQAARDHKVRGVKGFGEKTEQKILQAIERRKQGGEGKRINLAVADEITRPLVEYLRNVKGVKRVEAAGSYRRQKETVGDLDIVVTCSRGCKVMDRFVKYEDVQRVLSKGKTKSSVVLRSEFQVDLRVVPQVSFGAALYYFTGSKAHNVAVRKLALRKDLKVNEYGVFKKDKRVAGKTEEEVFAKVGLPYIEPEMRENRGEIEAAQHGKLPDLVKVEDIRGDLQSHTTETDGKFSLEEMVDAAREKGYEYLAITDHSQRVTMAKGLDAKRLRKQMKAIDKLNGKQKGFLILKSVEVDILEDGTLDLPDDVLEDLDIVICSVHYNLNLSKSKMTDRVLRALDNPNVDIMAHPSGRIIGKREPYEIDMEKVMKAALDNGCYMEINAQPGRLDLSDTYIQMAKDIGLKLAISTDAHTLSELDYMRFGVAQARRGWLETDDVLNTRSWEELKKLIRHTRSLRDRKSD